MRLKIKNKTKIGWKVEKKYRVERERRNVIQHNNFVVSEKKLLELGGAWPQVNHLDTS